MDHLTSRRTGPDRYPTSPAHCAAVCLAILATVAVVIGTAAGPRAGLVAAGLLFGLGCAAVLVLVVLALAVTWAHETVQRHTHRRALRRAGLDRVDAELIEERAVAQFGRRLDKEA